MSVSPSGSRSGQWLIVAHVLKLHALVFKVFCCAVCVVHRTLCVPTQYVWPCAALQKAPPFLVCDSEHPSSLRIQTTWLHGPSILAVRPPLSLSPNMNLSSFTQISWFAFLIYMCLRSSNCLIMQHSLINVLRRCKWDNFNDWCIILNVWCHRFFFFNEIWA